jgi:hypothetical protein
MKSITINFLIPIIAYLALSFPIQISSLKPIQDGVLRIRSEQGMAKMRYHDIFLITNAIVTKWGTNVKGHKIKKMTDFSQSAT